MVNRQVYINSGFLSTPSGWRATVNALCRTAFPSPFLSTPSGWRATIKLPSGTRRKQISIHALRVEGDCITKSPYLFSGISIHALRVEGDHTRDKDSKSEHNFYPRPPGGGRRAWNILWTKKPEFLSTPSGWRATIVFIILVSSVCVFLSTPSGWRATPRENTQVQAEKISIHALRVEGDNASSDAAAAEISFLSTPSGWRVTQGLRGQLWTGYDFYPRPPGGG